MDSESVVSSVQRKIELQSPEDLAYLMNNVRKAATERLNEAFPQVEGEDGEDELRTQIETLVNQVSSLETLSLHCLASPGTVLNSKILLSTSTRLSLLRPITSP